MDRKNIGTFNLLLPYFLNLLPARGEKNFTLKITGGVLLGLLIFSVTFLISYRMLAYFDSFQLIGPFLINKILSLILLTFFTLLIFSNLITSLGTFFIASDLQLLAVTPVDQEKLFRSRFISSTVLSSWMVLVFGMPVFIAYGVYFQAGVFYYILLPFLLIPFLIIPSVIGKLITEILINVFPVRTLRDLFVLITVIFAGGMVLLFRMIRPERLVNPEFMGSIGNYISALSQTQVPYLPSTILNNILIAILKVKVYPVKDIVFFFYSGYIFYLISKYSFFLFFRPGLSRSIEGRGARIKKQSGRIIEKVLYPLHPFTREMIIKDLRLFFRDASQWSQLLLLLFLIVIYLYNFSVLPLDKTPINSFYLKNIIGFANLILSGFVIAALGARFVFPSISVESRSLWLIKGGPVDSKRFLLSKMLFNLIPLSIVGFTITYFSCVFLNTSTLIKIVSTVSILLLTGTITTFGLYMGTIFPVFKFENIAQIVTSYGGIIYMLVSSIFVLIYTGIIAFPTYRLFTIIYTHAIPSFTDIIMITVFYLLALTIVLISYILPFNRAVEKFEEMEL